MSAVRYRLQRKQERVMPNILGNHSMPVYTYEWKDIYASDDRAALEEILNQCDRKTYRISLLMMGGG